MIPTPAASDVAATDVRRVVRRLVIGGLLLGAGLGGFVDGIVLHQILQWHHLLTDSGIHAAFPRGSRASLETNTLWDGLFHALTWVSTVAGLVALWRAAVAGHFPNARRVVGLALAGWGIFNLVEGTLSHHVLGLHHVRDDIPNSLPWDVGFLLLGAILVVVGLGLWRGSTYVGASHHADAERSD